MLNQDVSQPLPRHFYFRDPLVVARELLGKKLVREYAGQRLEGVITEVEAYFGDGDTGSHASRGQTARNAVMRSEEHTSELQSRPHLVCRLLLEKKNIKLTNIARPTAESSSA